MKTMNLNLAALIFRSKNIFFHTVLLFAGLFSLSSTLLAADPFQVSIKNAEYDSEKSQRTTFKQS